MHHIITAVQRYLAVLLTLLIALELLEVHGPDGQTAFINVQEISALRAPNTTDLGKYFTSGARCVITTSNGKFVAVVETCKQLRDRLTR